MIGKITNPTPEQIAEWEKEYGELLVIKVKKQNGEEGTFCFKKNVPNKRHLVIEADKALMEKDLLKRNELIIYNTLVNGLEIVQNDDDYFLALCSYVGLIMNLPEAQIVKR